MHTEAAVFVVNDGKTNLARENLIEGQEVKVVILGVRLKEAQLDAIKTIWRTLRNS